MDDKQLKPQEYNYKILYDKERSEHDKLKRQIKPIIKRENNIRIKLDELMETHKQLLNSYYKYDEDDG